MSVDTAGEQRLDKDVSIPCEPNEICEIGGDKRATCVYSEERQAELEQYEFEDPVFDLVYSGSILEPPICSGQPSCKRTKNEITVTLSPKGGEFTGTGIVSENAAFTEDCPVTTRRQDLTFRGNFDPDSGSLSGTVTYTTTGSFYVTDKCVLNKFDLQDSVNFKGTLSEDKITGTIGSDDDNSKATFELKAIK